MKIFKVRIYNELLIAAPTKEQAELIAEGLYVAEPNLLFDEESTGCEAYKEIDAAERDWTVADWLKQRAK